MTILAQKKVILIVFGWLFLLAACLPPSPTPEVTPQPSATPTSTPAPTSTPLPTFTPTPTALPLTLSDHLRSDRLATPFPQRGAQCGVVDILDFPLGPPDGEGFAAPWPLGHYSERYNGIHAGEDWISLTGGSLGQPVHSIGHGTVLYAQPLGWGIDLGTIIVRHVFADGSTILSFYGHLDPESVTLHAGDCVQRGDIIGRVGNPRGRPHLHFEIRSIYPDRPGPGYWPVDPQLAGWKPPTEYIWDERVRTSPGVKWTRPFTAAQSLLVGVLISDTIAAVENDRLVGLETDTGRLRWSMPLSDTIQAAQVDDTREALYLLTTNGALQAIDAAGELRWQIALPPISRAVLLSRPGGGVIAPDGQGLRAFSPDGVETWHSADVPAPQYWLQLNGQLFFTTDAESPALYQLDRSGHLQALASLSGRLTASRDHLFVYDPDALYRLSDALELIRPLDRRTYDDGSLVTAWDGSVIVAHHGVDDRRLMAFNPDGSLRWERSIATLTAGAPELIAVGRRVYAVTAEGDVWWIDSQSGATQRVLAAQRLQSLPGRARVFTTDYGVLIIDFRGGRLLALDPRAAIPPPERDAQP